MKYFVVKKLVLSFILSIVVIGLIVLSYRADHIQHQKDHLLTTAFADKRSVSVDAASNLLLVQSLMEQAKLLYDNVSRQPNVLANAAAEPVSVIHLTEPNKVLAEDDKEVRHLVDDFQHLASSNEFIKPISRMIQKQRMVEKVFLLSINEKNIMFAKGLELGSETVYLPFFNWLFHKQQQLAQLVGQKSSIFVPPFYDPLTQTTSEYLVLPLYRHDNSIALLVTEIHFQLLPKDDEVSYVVWDTTTSKTVATNVQPADPMVLETSRVLLASRYIPKKLQRFSNIHLPTSNQHQHAKLTKSGNGPEYLFAIENIDSSPYRVIYFKVVDELLADINERSNWFIIKIALFSLFGIVFIFGLLVWKIAIPTSSLISHIEQQSSLYDLDAKPGSKGWEKWFDKVSLAYKDNRKLLQSLMTKNKHLDHIVQSRTQELQAQTHSKDRNIALNRSIMNSIPDMIYYKNLDGGFLGCNSAFEYYAGLSETQIVAQHADDIFPAKMAEDLTKFDFQALRSKRPFSGKSNHTYPNGREAVIQWLTAPIVDSDGEVHGLLGLGRDITEQEASVQKIDQARQEAVVANETKSHFIANMSHEIRTPMNAVMGMLSLLESAKPTLEQKNYIDIAQTSSRHLIQIINDILDFSKVSADKIELHNEVFAFSNIIDVAFANSLPEAMKKDLILDVDISPGFPELFIGDEVRISQIFINIIGNAVKFTESGHVKMQANYLSRSKDGHIVEFIVTDTGVGIPQAKQEAVFEAFTQADSSITREFGGTGLGLTIVYQLVELMGGKTELWSKVGQGTEFKVTLTLGHVPEQIDFSGMNKTWILCESQERYLLSMKNKMKSANQQAVILTVEELAKSRIPQGSVLMCRPETLTLLPANIVASIHSGDIELQPLTFRPDELATNCLYTIPHYPVLAMPFTANKMLLNLMQPKLVETHPEQQLPLLSGCQVLVVEDNEVNQQVLKLILTNEGADVVCADNGVEGLAELQRGDFELVILDIQMPVMDGITCAKEIRKLKKWRNLPIIAMTAHNTELDKQNSLQAGINLHLNKPIEKEKLLSAICELTQRQVAEENGPTNASKNLAAAMKTLGSGVVRPNTKLNWVVEYQSKFADIDWLFLAKQFNNNLATIKVLLGRFKLSKKQAIESFIAQINELPANELRDTLHNYKGMFGSIGAVKLAQVTRQLEIKSANGAGLAQQDLSNWQQDIERLFEFIDTLD